MNYDEMARKMARELLDIVLCGNPTTRFVDFRKYIGAKLKELLPVPEDLESAVRKGLLEDIKYTGDTNTDWDAMCVGVVSAVGPRLAERDERIKELEKALLRYIESSKLARERGVRDSHQTDVYRVMNIFMDGLSYAEIKARKLFSQLVLDELDASIPPPKLRESPDED